MSINMGNFIESYFGNNFTNATSSFPAGMNFTNLVIAIPLLTTLLLLIINKFKLERRFSSIVLFVIFFSEDTIFNTIMVTILTVYFMELILRYFRLCCNYKTEVNFVSIKQFANIIKLKAATLSANEPAKNILISGHWGSGKSHFVKNILPKTINSSIYVSCTDYSDIIDLVNDLIQKSNPWMMRIIIRFSLSKLLSIISKTELRQYIGREQVIIFDEFERLVDYNKIDHMHIVSLIQYLNHEKNCVCILVANEDHLNDTSQFTNVREKLISAIYHYKLPFDDVLKIIKDNNKELSVNLKEQQFSRIYQSLNKWYQIDNNIRMIEHLYIKINQLYQATLQMIDEDDFLKKNYTTDEQKNKLFTGLFAYIDTIIVQLYYLYLKSPQYLSQIEKLAIIYTNEIFTKDKETRITPVHLYIDKDSIQNLALKYESQHILVNKDNYLVVQSKINEDLSTIIKDSFFENITQTIITEYLGRPEFVIKFLESNEYQISFHNNIKTFMSKFKNLICESEHADLIIKYFKQIDVFEDAFLNEVENNSRKTLNMDTISEYIHFVQGSNNTETRKYNKVAYINALFIQDLESSSNISDALINEIIDYYNTQEKSKLITVIYKIIAQYAGTNNKIETFIQLVSQIVLMISEKYNSIDDYFIFLEFMNQSYYKIKNYRTPATIQICNKNLINLLTANCNTKEFRYQLFMHLSNLNDGDTLVQNFNENSLPILVNKIKEIFNTNELKQEFINMYIAKDSDIPKQVAKILQAELDAAAKSSNRKENPDDK